MSPSETDWLKFAATLAVVIAGCIGVVVLMALVALVAAS